MIWKHLLMRCIANKDMGTIIRAIINDEQEQKKKKERKRKKREGANWKSQRGNVIILIEEDD